MTELYIALGITKQRADELTYLWNALGRRAKSSADCIILLETQPNMTLRERIFLGFCYGRRDGREDTQLAQLVEMQQQQMIGGGLN